MKLWYWVIGSLLIVSCASDLQVKKKINGVSYVAVREAVGPEQVRPLVELNAGYAAVMPFGFLRSPDSTNIIYNTDRQWFGEREEGVRQYIQELKKNKVAVMVKPHIWIGRGYFTGDLAMTSEEDWQKLETSYRSYILFYAHLAAEEKAELFCIGTELHRFALERPEFFRALIREIKTFYKGELTYAENWDQFNKIVFWDQLDMIGVDAYFPLSEEKTPQVSDLMRQWDAHKESLQDCAYKFSKPILFTEYGYRSTDFNTREPWDHSRHKAGVNHQAQVNALTAMAEVVWEESWFAGGFLWKWFPFHDRAGGQNDNQFTVQNKPAEAVIREIYKIKK